MDIARPAGEVWACVADYGIDPSWRAGVTQMRPSQSGLAQEGVTTHELVRLLGMSFRTDATIDRVEPGHRLRWRAHDSTTWRRLSVDLPRGGMSPFLRRRHRRAGEFGRMP